MTSHPEPVAQSMSLQQPPQSQYNMPDRDKQLLFSEFEDLSASFRSLYKSVFEQSFNQQGEWPYKIIKWKFNGMIVGEIFWYVFNGQDYLLGGQ